MPMYDLVEYSKNYSKKIGSLWQFCWDEPAVSNGDIAEFNANNATTDLFKLKEKRTGQTGNNGTKNIEIMVQLSILRNFWSVLEMPLINCKINLILTWSTNCIVKPSGVDRATNIFNN